MCSHALRNGWFYKYDASAGKAINVHADSAAVNINIWLGPNDHHKSKSGLVVYKTVPPAGWDFERFNRDPTPPEVIELIKGESIVVEHRQNRAVIFQMDLFHASDTLDWLPGYEKSRINLTLLFGEMRAQCKIEE